MINNKQKLGQQGEQLAREHLIRNGYKIIEKNFVCDFGEADIIATKDGELTFVEVKTRGQELFGQPADGITREKKKHIYKVAEYYIYANRLEDISISLDVIEIYLFERQKTRIAHIKNAILDNPYKYNWHENYNEENMGEYHEAY